MQESGKSILSGLKEYISKCPFLKDLELHVDQTESDPVNYSISTSGQIFLSEDILGNQKWQYNAILQSREYTHDDITRLDNAEFTESFIFWLQDLNNNGEFPDLPERCTAYKIYADNGIILSLDENGDRGIYQIQIHLIFERETSDTQPVRISDLL
ncbi:MAG: hypothetical protein Q4D35_03050 [Ruminococcus sp.]|nr:hypothetical protein [Ruminococcus sp.]